MEELLEILEDISPDVDFETEEALVDDQLLSSFEIISIISELNEHYGITLTPAEIIPENFNSARALWEMICRLKQG